MERLKIELTEKRLSEMEWTLLPIAVVDDDDDCLRFVLFQSYMLCLHCGPFNESVIMHYAIDAHKRFAAITHLAFTGIGEYANRVRALTQR